MPRKPADPLSVEDLECLIDEPPGSSLARGDREAIAELKKLAERHGFGRIAKLAENIRDIWAHPDKVAVYQRGKEEKLAFIKRCADEKARFDKEEQGADGHQPAAVASDPGN